MTAKKSNRIRPRNSREAEVIADEQDLSYPWLIFGLLTTVFIALTVWSWRKWPDILVDFGQQLYVPWQLAKGQRLYTDIALLHGPFSQYFNALWFALLGPSLAVLIYVNLGILVCMTIIIYRTARLFADQLTAAACVIVFLCVFAYGHYFPTGNYNWITPYTHEATHGVALTAAFILLWSRFMIKRERSAIALSALCLGLVLLTKVDTALAAVSVGLVGLISALIMRTKDSKFSAADTLLFGGMVAVPAIGFTIYFLTYMPIGKALAAVSNGLSIASNEIAKNPFFLRGMGLDDVAGNLTRMAGMAALLFGFTFVAAATDVFCRRRLRHPLYLGVPLASVTFIVLLDQPDLVPWAEIPRALLPATAVALIAFTAMFGRSTHRHQFRLVLLPMILWTVFALALLTKMALHVRVEHYGFYLAMPASLVVVACLLYWIPEGLKAKYQSGLVFRWLAVAVLATGIVQYLKLSDQFYSFKNFPIGKGGDMMLTFRPELSNRVTVMDSALKWMEEQLPPEATVAALPEGIMLNYLARRKTTLPVLNFMMTELIIFGQNGILENFKARPPDYVMLVHKDTTEWGVGPFGVDPQNGLKIMQWVRQNYTQVTLIGQEPFQTQAFGIKILRRNRQKTANPVISNCLSPSLY